jgi:hypothetical protein
LNPSGGLLDTRASSNSSPATMVPDPAQRPVDQREDDPQRTRHRDRAYTPSRSPPAPPPRDRTSPNTRVSGTHRLGRPARRSPGHRHRLALGPDRRVRARLACLPRLPEDDLRPGEAGPLPAQGGADPRGRARAHRLRGHGRAPRRGLPWSRRHRCRTRPGGHPRLKSTESQSRPDAG